MAVILVVLANISLFDAQFPVDRDREPVQDPHHFRGIFLVHRAGLVPNYALPELFHELFHFGPGKLAGKDKFIQVIGCTEECLGRGKGEVLGEEDEVYHKTMPEFAGHTHRVDGW